MDLTSLYYFTELAKDLHITRTANRLYISQQTLSNHILRLEELRHGAFGAEAQAPLHPRRRVRAGIRADRDTGE